MVLVSRLPLPYERFKRQMHRRSVMKRMKTAKTGGAKRDAKMSMRPDRADIKVTEESSGGLERDP